MRYARALLKLTTTVYLVRVLRAAATRERQEVQAQLRTLHEADARNHQRMTILGTELDKKILDTRKAVGAVAREVQTGREAHQRLETHVYGRPGVRPPGARGTTLPDRPITRPQRPRRTRLDDDPQA